MSSDLSVKIAKKLDIQTLLESGGGILQKILLLSSEPLLIAEQLHDGLRIPISESEILQQEIGTLIIKLKNEKEEVALVLTQFESHPKIEKSMVGLWAQIVVGAMRTPLEYVLAASLAIALAQETEAKVIDDALIWSAIMEQEPENLLQTLKLKRRFSDIHLAAKHIYNAMPITTG